jgi:predicted amidophosphoribosyltransferase
METRIPICAACCASLEPIRQPMCARCGRPFATAPAAESVQPICRLCRDNYHTFDFARSYGVYNAGQHHATSCGNTRNSLVRLAEMVAREPKAFQADVVVPVAP